jgi:hypothetical protein
MCDGELHEGTPDENEGGHNSPNAATRNDARVGGVAMHHLWGKHSPN